MTIKVSEPYYIENTTAVFDTDNNKTKVLYWTCNHEVIGGECIHCAIVIEGEE